MSVSKLKQQVANDARFARCTICTICCSPQKSRCVDRVASHISKCVWIAAQKPSWVNSQDLLPFVWFLIVDFSLAIEIDNATGHARARSGAKLEYRTQSHSEKKVSGRRFKTRSVGLVEAEIFFLFGLSDIEFRHRFFSWSGFIARKHKRVEQEYI